MPVTSGGGGSKGSAGRRKAYKTKVEPYNRSAKDFVKREAGPKKAVAVGKAVTAGNFKPFTKAVKKVTTKTEARGGTQKLKKTARQFNKSSRKIASNRGQSVAAVKAHRSR